MLKMITIRRPDDFHCHLRQGEMLKNVLPFTTNVFARATCMTNLVDDQGQPNPVETLEQAKQYQAEILASAPNNFEPIVPLMLTKNTLADELEKAAEENGCLCRLFSCEVLEIPKAKPYRRNKHQAVVA